MKICKMLLANHQFSSTSLLLIVFGIVLTDAEHPAVKIISPVENKIIRFRNQSILFNCTFSQANGSSFFWFRNNKLINPAGREEAPFWSSFVLKGLRAQDEGKYTCIYHQSGVKIDTVLVRLAAKPIVHYQSTSPVFVQVFAIVRLECSAEGWPVPNITWLRNGTNVLDINHNHAYVVTHSKPGHSILTIIGALKEEGGIYTCMAKNALGEDNLPFEVIVTDAYVKRKTTIRAEKSKHTAIVGTDANLVCVGEEVKADAFTFVFWTFNGTTVLNSSHYVITNDFFTIKKGSTPKVRTQLSVRNVTFTDSGNYSCVVDSVMATNEKDNITLIVQAKDLRTYWTKDKHAQDKGNGRNGLKPWIIALICVTAVILIVLLAILIVVVSRGRERKEFTALAQKNDGDQMQEVFFRD